MVVLTYLCPFSGNYSDPNHTCKSVHTEQKLLKRHILRCHIKHLHCPECGKRFGYNYEKLRHKGACKGVMLEGPVPQVALDLVGKLKACKESWDRLLFDENGQYLYDYEMNTISPPLTGLTSRDYPNEPNPSTTGHERMNLNYDSEEDGEFELETDDELGCTTPTRTETMDFDFDPSLGAYSDPTHEGATLSEEDGEFELETDDELGCTTPTETETMDFYSDPSLGAYSDPTHEGDTLSDLGPSPEASFEEPVAPDNENGPFVWDDFDDPPGPPGNSTIIGHSLQNVTEAAFLVPHAMDVDQWGGHTEPQMSPVDTEAVDTSLYKDPEQQIYNNTYHGHDEPATELSTVSMGYPGGPPYSDNAPYPEVRPDVNQLHNEPNAGVCPEDIFSGHWAAGWY